MIRTLQRYKILSIIILIFATIINFNKLHADSFDIEFNNSATTSLSAIASDEIDDPLEGVNRAIFQFNELADIYILEPVADFYGEYVPKPVQDSLNNVISIVDTPKQMVNNLLQGEVDDALTNFWYSFVNLTLGIGGIFDVASEFGMKKPVKQDFGKTLAFYGVGEGYYHVVPFLGPSNSIDIVGTVVDSFLSPMNYFSGEITAPYNVLSVVDTRHRLSPAIKVLRENSFDLYSSQKSAYTQNRRRAIGQGRLQRR